MYLTQIMGACPDERQFAAATWAQDLMVGAVLDQLEESNIRSNTLVFFSGDNGPAQCAPVFDSPGPFRGMKRSLHEGGIRQTIVRVTWVMTSVA